MRIESMTASFGKLENKTLILQPGLNIIEAPNEWGKSTWCAFLLAMLYGLDSRARGGKNSIPDREHYAPWSGIPMSGSMTLRWEGRRITIERSSRGRIPMGDFRAYETDTGLPVPELRADNCGQMLLGVEQSVYRRSGFIRMSEMAVSEDDALRQRLNALVSTADESGDAARLEAGLKELKNKCKYHKTGLIPQLEQEREDLEEILQKSETIHDQLKVLDGRLEENGGAVELLKRHLENLSHQRAREDAATVQTAAQQLQAAEAERDRLEAICAAYPASGDSWEGFQDLVKTQEALENARQTLDTLPPAPEAPEAFLNFTPGNALAEARQDGEDFLATKKQTWLFVLFLGLANLLGGAVMALLVKKPELGCVVALVGFVGIWMGLTIKITRDRKRRSLIQKYGSGRTEAWIQAARRYDAAWARYEEENETYLSRYRLAEDQLAELEAKWDRLTRFGGPDQVRSRLTDWEALAKARQGAEAARVSFEAIRSMARTLQPFEGEDPLDLDEDTTKARLEAASHQQQNLILRRAQISAQLEKYGSREAIEEKIQAVSARLAEVQKYYEALILAQETLEATVSELQRRFSPRITARARQILAGLTGNRYDRLLLSSDLRLQTAAGSENILRDALWRSDGTIDQLYLALRLAVSQELIPQAPLVLDDALVRFDDTRLAAALGILDEIGGHTQVILFTCQRREVDYTESCKKQK